MSEMELMAQEDKKGTVGFNLPIKNTVTGEVYEL